MIPSVGPSSLSRTQRARRSTMRCVRRDRGMRNSTITSPLRSYPINTTLPRTLGKISTSCGLPLKYGSSSPGNIDFPADPAGVSRIRSRWSGVSMGARRTGEGAFGSRWDVMYTPAQTPTLPSRVMRDPSCRSPLPIPSAPSLPHPVRFLAYRAGQREHRSSGARSVCHPFLVCAIVERGTYLIVS